MALPQSAHLMTPPVSSHTLSPALETHLLSFMASLAATTHSLGTPASGTGTAIHSSLGAGHASLDLLVARCAARGDLTSLCVNVAFGAVPPHAVVARWVERGRHFGRDKLRDLLEGVQEICVIVDAAPQDRKSTRLNF